MSDCKRVEEKEAEYEAALIMFEKFWDKILAGIGRATINFGDFTKLSASFRLNKDECKRIMRKMEQAGLIKISGGNYVSAKIKLGNRGGG